MLQMTLHLTRSRRLCEVFQVRLQKKKPLQPFLQHKDAILDHLGDKIYRVCQNSTDKLSWLICDQK
jgi:hypothetical protein